nr:dihydrofolate reductase [Paenibacillus hamazuiensis]
MLAMDENRAIGLNNQLPWRLPADLAYVKKLTMGHTLLMGRKTYESIGKPLPGRKNVVMTQRTDYRPEGCEVVHSVEEALERYRNDELFIFGGAEIFKLFLPYAERMYITEIAHRFEADTWFPEVDMSEWKEVSRTEGVVDEKNKYPHAFVVYERQNKE